MRTHGGKANTVIESNNVLFITEQHEIVETNAATARMREQMQTRSKEKRPLYESEKVAKKLLPKNKKDQARHKKTYANGLTKLNANMQ